MERLTIDEVIYCLKAECERYSEVCEECPLYGKVGCDHCFDDVTDSAINALEELKNYKDAEEDGLLKMLPVAIGSDVYFIPSKKNYDLNVLCNLKENNRVYHQKVERITFTDRGWYLECDKDCEYGTGRVLVDIFYKETWFTSEEEAEQALAKMKGE